MALYKNNDWNTIGLTKGKNYTKKINCTLTGTQVIALLAEIGFDVKRLCRKILNIMCLIMFIQATGFYVT